MLPFAPVALEVPHELEQRLRVVAPVAPGDLGELREVTPVRGDRVRRQPALDAQLDEERVDRVGQLGVDHCARSGQPAAARRSACGGRLRLVAGAFAGEHRRQLGGALLGRQRARHR